VKILFIHNRYQLKGGEDAVFDQEVELLSHTEEVRALTFQNHGGLRGALQFLLSVWNVSATVKIKKVVRQFQPEVIHVHNWHYGIGPLVIRMAHKLRIPVVCTIHNYRLLCPSATLLNRNAIYLESLHVSFPWKAVRNKLYRNSFLQTFWLAFVIWFHKKMGTWRMVNCYIVLTEFAKRLFISSSFGVPESLFVVKPNFSKDPGLSLQNREDYFLFIGRLSEEKGIDVLLEAFKHKEFDLYIGGEGPLRDKVINAGKGNARVHYLGMLDKETVKEKMNHCSALIFPSIWYEGMPMTLIEAFALGTPVITSNLGAMGSMVRDGYNGMYFTADDPASLSEKIAEWSHFERSARKQYSANARSVYEEKYTPEHNRKEILSIYETVIKNKLNS
jgi:glycosyltransferase involved in cell wall biosynthesis